MKNVLLLALLATTALAEEGAPPPNDGWKGSGELGYVTSRGNADTETFTSAIKMNYKAAPWESEVGFAALRAKDEEGEVIADRRQVTGQSNYSFSEKSYWFGAVRYEEDEFSGFDYSAAGTLGYGHRFWEDANGKLAVELGAGHRTSRYSDLEETPDDESELKLKETIMRFKLTHFTQVTDTTKWTNDLLVEKGEDNTFSEFTTGFLVDISTSFKLKLAHNIRRNSEVPPEREKEDTITTVNLVFAF
jgi:putative salt-induced outer membrane protein